jgi:hypothetical protein
MVLFLLFLFFFCQSLDKASEFGGPTLFLLFFCLLIYFISASLSIRHLNLEIPPCCPVCPIPRIGLLTVIVCVCVCVCV